MRRIGLIVGFIVGTIAGSAIPGTAQVYLSVQRQMDVSELKRLTHKVADEATIRRQLDSARASVRSRCRSSFFSSQKRTRQRCDAAKARVAALERQLRGSSANSGTGGRNRKSNPSGRVKTTWSARSTYRTICVRVCDGYYYSLSHTGSRRRFEQDAQKCAGQYPPGEAVLFYHPFPGDDVSQARSLEGRRYEDQEYAFAFRKAFKPQCAARLHKGLTALKQRVYEAVPYLLQPIAADPVVTAGTVPIPTPRYEGLSDPETLDNRAGMFVPAEVAPLAIGMRTVGDPHYFPEEKAGPPATVAGYQPPELVDYRLPKKSSALQVIR
jgi:Protein of unknown function (DUF2865)